jgi:hypothetical protein
MKEEFCGLGIPNIRELNLCLLGSWLRRYSLNDNKIWRQLIDYKYNTTSPNIFTCRELGSSNFWQGVLWVVKVAKLGYRWKAGKGSRVRFWEDLWMGTSSLVI